MGRLHPFSFILAVLIGIICLIMAVFSYAEDNIDREIKYWLRKAEEHANNVIDPNERNQVLFHLAASYVYTEHYEKAHSIVFELDESKRKMYWSIILMVPHKNLCTILLFNLETLSFNPRSLPL